MSAYAGQERTILTILLDRGPVDLVIVAGGRTVRGSLELSGAVQDILRVVFVRPDGTEVCQEVSLAGLEGTQ